MTAARELILRCRPRLRIVPIRTKEPQSRAGMLFDRESGILEWPIGPDGDVGEQGLTARPWTIVGYVTAEADLPSGLGPADARKAWGNTTTKAVHVWQGYRWHDPVPTGLSRPGDAGPPVMLTVGEISTLQPGSNVAAEITGDAPDRVLNLGMPRGAPGDKGAVAPASILRAVDYVGYRPTRGQTLSWSSELEGWVATRQGGVLGEWSLTDAEIETVTASTGQDVVLATTTLAPLGVPYRLSCSGLIAIEQAARSQSAGVAVSDATVTVYADYGVGPIRIGIGRTVRHSTDNGGLIAFQDRILVVGAYASKLTPSSTVGVVPADRPAVITVVLNRLYASEWINGVKAIDGAGNNIQLTGRPI